MIRAVRRRLVVALALLFAAAAPAAAQDGGGSGGHNRPEQLGKPYVVLVSFDGFRHDYLDRYDLPTFREFARRGARAESLIPVFPSKTFPSHYSMVTGLYPGRHGIVGNRFYDPGLRAQFRMGDTLAVRDARWWGGEPIWVTAEKKGMVTASMFWVGSEAPIRGIRPSHFHTYDGSRKNDLRVAQVLDWLSLAPERRPHFITLYFSDVDNAGHDHGPDSGEVERAARLADRLLRRLLDGIAALPHGDRVHVVVVSDHGMAKAGPDGRIFLDDVIELDGVRVLESGAVASLWFDDAARIAPAVATLRGRLKHVAVYRPGEMPERLHLDGNARVGHILLVAEEGFLVGARASLRNPAPGQHGYEPRDESMHGIFLALGPRIRPGARVPSFESVHVYPLLARLLDLDPVPGVDARLDPLAAILR